MKTILLIDHDPVNTIRISEILQQAGRRLLHAPDAKQGMRILRDEDPGLVIYHLPENRRNTHKTLQTTLEALSARNIALLCVMGRRDSRGAAPEILGPKQYLVKPFSRDELLRAVEDHLEHENRERAISAHGRHQGPELKLR